MNSNFPYRWSPASLTLTTILSFLYITRIIINNNAPHLKSPKNQTRRAALGRPAMRRGGGALINLRSINPRPWFCLVSPSDKFKTKASHHKTITNHSKALKIYLYLFPYLKPGFVVSDLQVPCHQQNCCGFLFGGGGLFSHPPSP